MPTTILLDAGIFIHSEFAELAVKEVPYGSGVAAAVVHGLKRKPPDPRDDYQQQKDALFTIGRMIRERKISAFTSSEIEFEHLRGRSLIQEFNALENCEVDKCEPALDRSRFQKTSDFIKFMAKGGKKDRDRDLGVSVGAGTQLAFMKWLYDLDMPSVTTLIEHAPVIGLSPFEIQSLNDLDWFRAVCKRSGSPNNYPDVFHLWTARRHGLHVLLTLEKSLPNLVARIQREKKGKIEISTEVLRPLDLLRNLGVSEPDPVPIKTDHFYQFYHR